MKIRFLIIFLFAASFADAQEKESFYVFNSNWKPTKMDSAIYMLHIHFLNDTCWQFDYYRMAGPLIKTERYRDANGTVKDGISCYYNSKGYLDSSIEFRNGQKIGYVRHQPMDSLAIDTAEYKIAPFYLHGKVTNWITDTIAFHKGERESEYPGGNDKWTVYIRSHVRYPQRAFNLKAQGTVKVQFKIDREGLIKDIQIRRSVEYSLDEEAMRIIRESGWWRPAYQNGGNVVSYKIQPIHFSLSE